MHPNPTLESRLECYGGGYDLRVAVARRDLHVLRFVAFVAPEIESEATLRAGQSASVGYSLRSRAESPKSHALPRSLIPQRRPLCAGFFIPSVAQC